METEEDGYVVSLIPDRSQVQRFTRLLHPDAADGTFTGV